MQSAGESTVLYQWKAETEGIHNPFGYAGEYTDEETGLIYLRNRYYAPNAGRFITEDPIRDGLNWYVYCGNNPIMFADPLGLEFGTLRSFVNDADGSITIPEGSDYAIVNVYGKTKKVYFDTSQNANEMINVEGTIYMDRKEFLEMMGVQAIVTSSGQYDITAGEALVRNVAGNLPQVAGTVYLGNVVNSTIIGLVGEKLATKILKTLSIAGELTSIGISSIKVEPGSYIEERFLVKYNGMIHSIGVISKADENGNFMEDVTINSVTPEEWGLPWEEREEALRNANISKPNASAITIN